MGRHGLRDNTDFKKRQRPLRRHRSERYGDGGQLLRHGVRFGQRTYRWDRVVLSAGRSSVTTATDFSRICHEAIASSHFAS
jgi:hypothetical protein